MSSLAEVRDVDCIASSSPLVFDLSAKEVTGAAAVLRRILYRWCSRRGAIRHAAGIGLETPLTDLDAATLSDDDLAGLRTALEREAKDEDFVVDAAVTLALLAGRLFVASKITLTDGQTYPLEVLASAASAALLAIGASA
jgi:hypothetical protein